MPSDKNPFEGKEEPWISFCMPCFNEANRVADAMRSVLSQDYPNTELVIVNDGSRDRSAKRIQDTINQLPLEKRNRCKFINLKKNVGACTARNMAAEQSKGAYLAFLPADAYLYPGVARLWVNTFADNPDCDFVYCGYRFVEDGSQFGKPDNKGVNYVSEPFQPYILETRNYIDGTYPIRRELFEKMGGWNPAIKSLQDWEYWLRAVKKFGAKGYYYPAIVFETEFPHAGGLSDDSSHNWLDRVDQIKNKLDIPINKNCVVAFGAEFHAINIAKMIGADISPIPNFKPNHYEGLYFVGGYPQFIEQVDTAVRINRISDAEGRPISPVSPTKRIMHWIGSDVYFMQELSRRALETDVNYYNQIIDVHLCETPHIRKELRALGIKARIVPIPPRKLYDLMPLPETPTVACYLPDGGTAPLYNPQLMETIAGKMPDVKFIFYGKGMPMKKKKNIEYRVFNPDEKVYDKLIADSTVLVRLMVHDGLSLSIPEFATAGRQIVTNIKLDEVIVPEDNTIAGVVKAIRKALKLGVNKNGAEYYKKLMDPKKFKKTINDLLDYNPKEYWDNRAASWQNQASSYASDYDKKIVNQTINNLKPQTVLDVGCFTAETLISTPDGQKQIKEIECGDTILDQSMNPVKVLKIFERKARNRLDISFGGSDTSLLRTTTEHPILSISREDIKKQNLQKQSICPIVLEKDKPKVFASPKYREAGSLKIGDMLSIPRHHGSVNSSALARLLGYYLAEGSLIYSHKPRLGGICFTFHIKETQYAEEVRTLALQLGATSASIKMRPNKNICEVRTYSKGLATTLFELGGKGSKTKQLSSAIRAWDYSSKLSVLTTWLLGDGHRGIASKSTAGAIRWSGKSASKLLLQSLRGVAWDIGTNPSFSWDGESGSLTWSGDDSILIDTGKREQHIKSPARSWRVARDYIFLPIKRIDTNLPEETVLNLSVTDSQTYIANGVAVHNCGNGQWSPLMPEDYIGIDISSKMVDIARKNYPARRFEEVKLEDLPVRYQYGEKFDLAFCHTVFLHIKEKDIKKAVDSLKKFAKKAIIIEPTICKTINYQIHHDIPSLFKVIKTIPLKERTLYVVNLEE